ncbi:hypothetical protein [Pedobacter sp. L105]|uniref:hypothetical protein n=1 Tax=Pedobacter sp. L105 TaxID=1641871 RepID=UPI00131BAE40|nr:hypothetical protein [Pedobacter sp. L105]
MSYVSKNNNDPIVKKDGYEVNIEHPKSNEIFKEKIKSPCKKSQKTYTVTVTYIQLTDEEAKIKRAIIESILKKGFRK